MCSLRAFSPAWVCLLLAACSSSVDAPVRRCGTTESCPAAHVCIAETCRRICNSTADCDPSQICASGVCLRSDPGVEPSTEPPTITSIDGTGSTDATAGHTSKHLRDRVIINGTNFGGALVRLSSGANEWLLETCEPSTTTRMAMALPTNVKPGAYTITVVNQAGSCSAALNLLQGEPGSLDASGAQLVESINETLSVNPTLRVSGSLHGKVSTLALSSSVSGWASRTIVVNGAQLVDQQGPGLFLTLIDGATHALVGFVSGVTVRTSFSMTDSVERGNLKTILADAEDDDVLLVTSTGDVSNLKNDAELVAALKSFGASRAIEQLDATHAYALIGMSGIGAGNGLEQIGGAERAGIATLSSALVDGAVIGMRTTPPAPVYSGANFATSNQACSGSQKVTGINASGGITCGGDVDTDTSCTFSAPFQGSCSAPSCGTGVIPTLRTLTCAGSGSTQVVVSVALCSDNSGCNCFTAGTRVRMADGRELAIEDVEVGDEVQGASGSNRVLALDRHALGARKLYALNGGEAFVTEDHPFRTTGGWKSLSPRLTAATSTLAVSTLEVGDVVITEAGALAVDRIDAAEGAPSTTVYNFLLDGDRTYFANGYLVHSYNDR